MIKRLSVQQNFDDEANWFVTESIKTNDVSALYDRLIALDTPSSQKVAAFVRDAQGITRREAVALMKRGGKVLLKCGLGVIAIAACIGCVASFAPMNVVSKGILFLLATAVIPIGIIGVPIASISILEGLYLCLKNYFLFSCRPRSTVV